MNKKVKARRKTHQERDQRQRHGSHNKKSGNKNGSRLSVITESNFLFELENKDDFDWGLYRNRPEELSFKDAVKLRKRRIAWLRKHGKRERANLLAQCQRGNRCYLNDCPVCERRHEVNRGRLPKSVIRRVARSAFGVRFCVTTVKVDAIRIAGPRRPVNERKLRELKASIVQIGLQTPITVRLSKNQQKAVLVAGLHRLIAMKQLGARYIPCFEHFHEESESYAWQRAENVYRAEPRVLERAEAINEMRQAILREGGQVAPPGGRQPKNLGIKKAAKVLGLTKDEVRRSMRIAERISPEAKADARKLGVDNQDALLQIAKLPADAQRAAVSAIAHVHLAARARLASSAVAVANKKTVTKIEAIEEQIKKKESEIAKKNEQLQALKRELTDKRDSLDEACRDLAAAYVNDALIGGPTALSKSPNVVTVRGGALGPHDQGFTPNEKNILDAIVAAWNELQRLVAAAPFAIRDHFIHEYMQKAMEGYSKTDLDVSEAAQDADAGSKPPSIPE